MSAQDQMGHREGSCQAASSLPQCPHHRPCPYALPDSACLYLETCAHPLRLHLQAAEQLPSSLREPQLWTPAVSCLSAPRVISAPTLLIPCLPSGRMFKTHVSCLSFPIWSSPGYRAASPPAPPAQLSSSQLRLKGKLLQGASGSAGSPAPHGRDRTLQREGWDAGAIQAGHCPHDG